MLLILLAFPTWFFEPRLKNNPAAKPEPKANARRKSNTGEIIAAVGSFFQALTTNGIVEIRKISVIKPLSHQDGDQKSPRGIERPRIPTSNI
jgi:hypothetical protein